MTYRTASCDLVDRLVGSDVQEYDAPTLAAATEQLREDVRATFGDEAAAEVRSSMLEVVNAKYMNAETGSVATRDGWWYEDEDGQEVNAVDRGEVVEVVRYQGCWIEPHVVDGIYAAAEVATNTADTTHA